LRTRCAWSEEVKKRKMTRLRLLLSRLLHRGPRVDEFDRDISAYVDLLTDERQRAGLTHDAARRAALADVGDLQAVREAVRDEAPLSGARPTLQDIRHALRLMRRSPGVTCAVVLAAALGIGATSATFSAVDAVLLRPLPYADADRLVVLLRHGSSPTAPGNFLDWRRSATSFDAMGAAEYWSPNLRGQGTTEKILALHVTPDVLSMLGVPPELGRLPASGPEGTQEVVLADALWRRRFNADSAVLGRAIQLDETTAVVVGVMPATFHFAPFWATKAELWGAFDLSSFVTDRTGESLRVFARLKPGVSLASARAEIAGITGALEARFPGTNSDIVVTPLKDKVVGDVRTTMIVLFGAVGCVLLIACANVAHLLLARASTRRREFAVRCAIGAARSRVVRQLLTESVVLALTGGTLGIVVAYGGLKAFALLGATSVPRLQTMTLDGRVLGFALVLSILTGIVFGLAPARALARLDVTADLRCEDRGSTSGRASRGTRRLLIASQLALALVLLTGAGLLLRSFLATRAIEPGFSPAHVVSFVVSVAGTAEEAPGRRGAFYDDVVTRLRAMPGVTAAAAINHMPLVGDAWGIPYLVEGRTAPAGGKGPSATYRVASAGYFETMQIRMVAGRAFQATDRDGGAPVVIVNARLARDAWPGESAVGKRLRVPFGDAVDQVWRTVIGVSGDTVRQDLHDAPEPEMFLPLAQNANYRTSPKSHLTAMTFVARTAGDPATLMPSIRAAVNAIAPDAPVSDVFLLQQAVDEASDGARVTAVLIGVFATVALVLAALGIFGVISHDVATRRREIGIRLALGATPGRVAADIAREGLGASAVGLVSGLALAIALRHAVATLLFGVQPLDVPTLAAATIVLAAVASAGCAWPAIRATVTSPAQELK
jgi:putative ABC transport system permease protein